MRPQDTPAGRQIWDDRTARFATSFGLVSMDARGWLVSPFVGLLTGKLPEP